MTAPVLTMKPQALSSEVALLGERAVGAILPYPGSRHRATWMIKLPDWPQCQGPATSFEGARRKIEHEVREWLRSAGLGDAAERLIVSVEKEKARA